MMQKHHTIEIVLVMLTSGLFREVEKMTSGERTNIFPSSLVDPADQFLTYFNYKIPNLCSKLCELPVLEPNIYLPPCTCSSSFSFFLPATETYIKHIVLKTPTKFCELVPNCGSETMSSCGLNTYYEYC